MASGSEDRTIKVWDAAAGTEAFTLDAAAGGHDADVTSLAFEPTGKRLVSGGDDRKLVVWDLETRKPVATLAVDQRIPYILWAAGGGKFVAWQSSKRGEAETNNFKTYDPDGKPLNSLDLKDRSVFCATFTTDGELGFDEAALAEWYGYQAKMRDSKAVPPASVITEDASASIDQQGLSTNRFAMNCP